jgi:hypothetical protein
VYIDKFGLALDGAALVVFLQFLRKISQFSSQWEAMPIPEEMSQTLLTNKKQGNLDYVHADNIIKLT